MSEENNKKEADDMLAVKTEYNEKIFLSELKKSLEEMKIKRNSDDNHSKKTSWRDLFNKEEE